MALDLPLMARAAGLKRNIVLRQIEPASSAAVDLAAIYAPAWRMWAHAMPAIMAEYDARPLGDGLTSDSIDGIRSVIEATAGEFLTRLVVSVTPSLTRWAVRREQVHRKRWIASVAAGTGINLATILTAAPVSETLEAFIARNVALVRNISDQAQGRIADAVFRGYQQRLPVREVAKEIGEAVVMGRRRAIGIAADQNAKLSAALDAERHAEAGIEYFRWRHSGKLHPRAWHKERDGRVYDWKSRKQKGGDERIEADDLPGMQPYCGCRAQAWIGLMDEIG